MTTLFKYTDKNMSGWEFLLLTDNGRDGFFVTGNTASTAVNYNKNDMAVIVKSKKQLKEIAELLDWLGCYTNKGDK